MFCSLSCDGFFGVSFPTWHIHCPLISLDVLMLPSVLMLSWFYYSVCSYHISITFVILPLRELRPCLASKLFVGGKIWRIPRTIRCLEQALTFPSKFQVDKIIATAREARWPMSDEKQWECRFLLEAHRPLEKIVCPRYTQESNYQGNYHFLKFNC